MTLRLSALTLTLALITIPFTAANSLAQETSLSNAQNRIVNNGIDSLKGAADRQLAQSWTNAKKVAEFICRPVALPTLKAHLPGVDRVFLGMAQDNSLTLNANDELSGIGTARGAKGWRDFTFKCMIAPETGRVTHFEMSLKPDVPH